MAAPTQTKPAEATSVQTSYRTDLDGLRGVAIMLVACFHIWFGRVSGGVDVFLTLSGYFFIGSLLRHTISSQSTVISFGHTVNPWPRLKRLLRRLLPALFTVLIAVSIATVLFMPQTRWVNIGREVIASGLYYQNWHLALNSQDYLAASSANSPLQHIWSMSVQGQFFVATLLLALGFAGVIKLVALRWPVVGDRKVVTALVAAGALGLAAISFYWAHMRMGVNQQWNYYDTFSRTWEPLAGGLLAIWMPRWRAPLWLRNVVGAIALAMIVSSGWLIVGVEQYPGPLALVPVGATLMLIWSGTRVDDRLGGETPQADVNRLLATKQAVWLGTIAYSLYLIHWPLLIFYLHWRDKDHANFFEGTALLIVSTTLAWLVKRYIEDPLRGGGRSKLVARHAQPRLMSYTALVTTILVIASLGTGVAIKLWERHVSTIVVDTKALDPALYPGGRALLDRTLKVPNVDPQPSPLEVVRDFPETSTDGFMSNFTDGGIHIGVYGDPKATKTIALAGGSHAEMWITALDALGKRNHFKVTTYLKMGCPLSTELVPKQAGVPYPQCHEWVERVMNRVIADKPDAVFTNSTRPRDAGGGDWTPDTYLPIFDRFTKAGIDVLGIRDTPWPSNAKGTIDTPACLAGGGNAETCGSNRRTHLNKVNPAIAAGLGRPRLHALDLSNGVCTEDFCPAIAGNIIVYKDNHHLSATYVRSLTDELGRQMAEVLPWTGGK
ncbi:putative acyltransferase [Gordonia effusa NBRC 100432]|uniref:Putative acyltransferase n=1 Tax=Gordonia effusa NBRC 100432 TaxID=1077974 RepID=H0R160_9ACTN|nr:acyltransferase family protein [Gordonia effusa]GAB18811.1 putative acyltransferase [Gordonia effusa NBRC 100432]